MRPRAICLLLLFVFVSALSAQTVSVPVVDVPVLKLPASVVLKGKVTWVSGGEEDSGNVTLKASLDGSSSEEWNLGKTGTLKWTQTGLAGDRTCKSVDASTKTLDLSGTNCWRPVPWFAPWTAPAIVTSKLATSLDLTNTAKLKGIQRTRYAPVFDPPKDPKSPLNAALKRLANDSAVQIDTSTETSLPSSLQFQEITSGPNVARLEVTVEFSDYRLEGGFLIPHRIKRYLQHALQADIQITSVSIQ